MLKFKRNTKNETLKELHIHFASRFQKAVELLQAGILTTEDAKFFCENEPTVSYVIEDLKRKKSDELKKQANKAILERDKQTIDINIELIEKERAVLEDEFSRLMLAEPVAPEDALQKQRDLNYLSDRMKACDVILKDLENCKVKHFKVQRGRPQKKEPKPISELAKDFEDSKVDNEILDKEIFDSISKLCVSNKKYIYSYIQKMLELEQGIN